MTNYPTGFSRRNLRKPLRILLVLALVYSLPSSSLINELFWLQGGLDCASLDALTKENGPVYFPGFSTMPQYNPNSWTKLANVVYFDQPVGSGYSGGNDQAANNAQVTQELVAVLKEFYAVFPGLKYVDTYIMGESYAEIYMSKTRARSTSVKNEYMTLMLHMDRSLTLHKPY